MTLIEWTFLTQWPAVVLFSSVTPDSNVGLFTNSSQIFSPDLLFDMSAGQEEEHGYEAIIKALMKVLMDINGSLTVSLKLPQLLTSTHQNNMWCTLLFS